MLQTEMPQPGLSGSAGAPSTTPEIGIGIGIAGSSAPDAGLGAGVPSP
jgi:hypothetical protein